ncbi:MAG: histone deacetylase family protein [Bacillota bacterium]
MDIIYSPECLNFKSDIIPETPERVKQAQKYLKEKGYNFKKPYPCKEEDLLLAHENNFIKKVKNQDYYDPESPAYDNIFYLARLAAGGAIKAAEERAFSLMRPPGHHAGKDFLGGFCYFNNLVIAVEYLGKKTLIIDIDAHHGNGTQDIIQDKNEVFYISLHKNIYPGTGYKSEKNYRNHVFREEVGDDKYLETLDNILKIDKEFDMIAVSAGFDGYKGDPLASLGLTSRGYYRIGQKIANLNLPVFCVLEGGYNPDKLGKNIDNFIQGLMA